VAPCRKRKRERKREQKKKEDERKIGGEQKKCSKRIQDCATPLATVLSSLLT